MNAPTPHVRRERVATRAVAFSIARVALGSAPRSWLVRGALPLACGDHPPNYGQPDQCEGNDRCRTLRLSMENVEEANFQFFGLSAQRLAPRGQH